MYTVLVLDDEESIRILYREELEEAGYRVLCAATTEQAWEILEKHEIHAVILDIKLRGESGLQFLQDLARTRRDLPVVLSTAYSSFKTDYSAWLADAYVVKSGSLDELKGELGRVLERRYGGLRDQ
ncbi:MAG: response regulator [Candidatus Dadabacteria bacterium]|nr:MAG: response regulator [Candidatus Dadabacteria bacterium]